MIYTLDDFKREFSTIQAQGWIRTHRSGPTGIGKTLEDLLGIPENNLDMPDFGEYELKSCRVNSNSMLTMFTLSPQPRGSNSYLLNKFGYVSSAYDNDEKVLHASLTASRLAPIYDTGMLLGIDCDVDKISIASQLGVEHVFWTRDSLKSAFEKKYKNKFVYAYAEARGEDEFEEFRFIEAYEMSGFDYDSLIDLLEKGRIVIDLRIGQYPDGRTHDHGTAFRIKASDQPLLFKIKRKIC